MTANEQNPRRLHLGCGPVILPGWLNIDYDHVDAEMHLNVLEGLPFEDGSVEFVFAEHFIEHFTLPQALVILGECHRVLRSGGVIRLSTPDLEWLVDAYYSRDTARWGALWQPATGCRILNEAFRSWGHQFLYDRDELLGVLKEAGFSGFGFPQHSHSSYKELEGLEARPFNNEIILEATKSVDEAD